MEAPQRALAIGVLNRCPCLFKIFWVVFRTCDWGEGCCLFLNSSFLSGAVVLPSSCWRTTAGMCADPSPLLKPPSKVSSLPVLCSLCSIVEGLYMSGWKTTQKKWLKCFWYKSCQLAHGTMVCREFFLLGSFTPLIHEKKIDLGFHYSFICVCQRPNPHFCNFHALCKHINIWNIYEQQHLDIILASCWDYATRIYLKNTRNPFIKFTTHTSWWLHNDSTTLRINLWLAFCLLNLAGVHDEMQQHQTCYFLVQCVIGVRHSVFNKPVCECRTTEGNPASETLARSSFNTSPRTRHHIAGLLENTGWWK